MHYHLIEHIISKVTLMEVEKAIWLFYDSQALSLPESTSNSFITVSSCCFEI